MATVTPAWYVMFHFLLTTISMIFFLKQTSSEKNVEVLKGWLQYKNMVRFNAGINRACCSMMFYLKFDLKRTTFSIKKEISF